MTSLQHMMASVAGVLAISLGAQAHAADAKKETPSSAPSVATTPAPPAASADPVVKKSDAGICHDKITPYSSMDECVKSGGKPPVGVAAAAPAPEVSMVKKSDSSICHDKSSPSYEKTKKFTEFKSMEECIKSGGRAPK
jgi:hypothetical protein